MNRIYQDPKRSVRARVEDLLRRMTLEEKIMQLHIAGWSGRYGVFTNRGGPLRLSASKLKKVMGKGMGQARFPELSRFEPRDSAELANRIQRYVMENTRLKIPVLIHGRCLHGCNTIKSAAFPQSIGLAGTWNPELIRNVSSVIGREMKAKGVRYGISPTVNIARDVRCGRTEETYGEDPCLLSAIAVAFVKGLQSQKVVATPRHFAANFVADGGRDSGAVHVSERYLREVCFPGFEACVRQGGALSIMTAYNSIDGLPCTANQWLLTDVLRKDWGFKGFVYPDVGSVAGIVTKHNAAQTEAEAVRMAIEAGLDVGTAGADCFREVLKLVSTGKLSRKRIDESVRRVLEVKFRIGLFEEPYADPGYAAEICDCDAHRKLTLEAARQSMVLLKNNGALPLSRKIGSVAVIGPNADVARLGGYSGSGMKTVTPLDGIRAKLSGRAAVYHAKGCDVCDHDKSGFRQALAVARKSDAVIMVMGNSEMTEGENKDRMNLDLPGVQEELIHAVAELAVPVIVVLIGGSAVTMMDWIHRADAVVEAWYPGEEGGNAVADVLFGDTNPGGKLPITFPKHTAQVPLYYNSRPTGRRDDYVDLRGRQALFPFGHGLSYTRFEYSNLTIRTAGAPRTVRVECSVRNAGRRRGDEVVQLYVRDEVSRVTRPVKELKAFRRVTLGKGESQTVAFVLGKQDFSYLGPRLRPVFEPGAFAIMIGSSSEDIRLQRTIKLGRQASA